MCLLSWCKHHKSDEESLTVFQSIWCCFGTTEAGEWARFAVAVSLVVNLCCFVVPVPSAGFRSPILPYIWSVISLEKKLMLCYKKKENVGNTFYLMNCWLACNITLG